MLISAKQGTAHPPTFWQVDRSSLEGNFSLLPDLLVTWECHSVGQWQLELIRVLLLRETLIFQNRIKTHRLVLFYAPWNLCLMQGHPHTQSGVDLAKQNVIDGTSTPSASMSTCCKETESHGDRLWGDGLVIFSYKYPQMILEHFEVYELQCLCTISLFYSHHSLRLLEFNFVI